MAKRQCLILIFLFATTILCAQDLKSYYKSGESAFYNENYYGATVLFSRVINKNPDYKHVAWNYAESCRLNKNYKVAIEWYVYAMQNDTSLSKSDLLYHLANSYKSVGKYDKASNYFAWYYNAAADKTSYERQKALQEAKICKTLSRNGILQDSTAVVRKITGTVNSGYSEYSPALNKDSLLYYSSYRPLSDTLHFSSSVYVSTLSDSVWSAGSRVGSIINRPDYNVANLCFGNEGNTMYLTLCSKHKKSECAIYRSNRKDNKWTALEKLPEKINEKGAITTQPSISKITNGEYLFFSSNRKGSYGQQDIWYCKIYDNVLYGAVQHCDSTVNTPGNELTPYYCGDSILYFSSDWLPGYGGYDIFSSLKNEEKWQTAINVGSPLNSSLDDLYYTIAEEQNTAYFVSNRAGREEAPENTCCNDIYQQILPPKQPKKDEIELLVTTEIDTIPEIANELANIGAFEVYFDNDQPLPRSRDTLTAINYKETYAAYLKQKSRYQKKYTFGIRSNKQAALKKIEELFETIARGHNDLELFCEKALLLCNNGYVIEVMVRGKASPLHSSDYNLNLSKRRISCVRNYFNEYKGGKLYKYIANKQLAIVDMPLSDSEAKLYISNSLDDLGNSVYSPEAALERSVLLVVRKVAKARLY